MRPPVDRDRIRALARELGREARRDTRLYLTGGATAVLLGWREATLDIDIRFEPEADELLRAVARLKDELGVNVELASPPEFVPELPGWRERSPFVLEEGRIAVHHFDLYSQWLSKVERGFAHDLEDADAMVRDGLVDPDRMRELFEQVEPELFRYPAIDARALRAKVERALG
ncbi:MAG TPA: DUF6036 family nucleotidyltransferase [Thermoleophilaceae bacterium]|jgi:hypothetical protein